MTVQPGDTISLQPGDTVSMLELLEFSTNERLGRATSAAERAADALERIAVASETLTALLASVIGVGRSTCHPYDSGGQITQPPAFFLRTGDGAKAFACDAVNIGDDDDDE